MISSEHVVTLLGFKMFRCDVVAVLDNKEECNIQIQLLHQEWLPSCMLLQTAKLHALQAKNTFQITAIKPTFALWIMPFDFTRLENCHNSARLRFDQDTNKVMSDDIPFHFFEFAKLHKNPKENGFALWRSFLGIKTIEDYDSLKRA